MDMISGILFLSFYGMTSGYHFSVAGKNELGRLYGLLHKPKQYGKWEVPFIIIQGIS
jgi:hypothetical protein